MHSSNNSKNFIEFLLMRIVSVFFIIAPTILHMFILCAAVSVARANVNNSFDLIVQYVLGYSFKIDVNFLCTVSIAEVKREFSFISNGNYCDYTHENMILWCWFPIQWIPNALICMQKLKFKTQNYAFFGVGFCSLQRA